MKKESAWGSVLVVGAFLLVKIASIAMQHPDWNANDWISLAGWVLLAGVALYGGVWLIKKLRAPKSVTPAPVTLSAPANVLPEASAVTKPVVVADPPKVKTCTQCKTEIEPGANFCCECGTAAA